jgi:hypothetical protein
MAEESGTAPVVDVDPTTFRTDPHKRLRVDPATRKVLRALNRRSKRSGRLSPLAYNLTISHRYRFVWFRVAKVASRTIFGHFESNGVELDITHGMRLRYPTEAFADYVKFAFVRDPLDRFVSAWRDKVVDHNYYQFDPGEHRRMQRLEAFAEWVAGHDLSDLQGTDHHLTLQSRAVDLSQIDLLGRLETFDADFDAVCAATGMPRVLPEIRNQSSRQRRQDVPAEVAERVHEMYAMDYAIFGYR